MRALLHSLTRSKTLETEPEGAGTLMTMRVTLPDAQTRSHMLATGMEHGMEASFALMERVIFGPAANAA
jgi:hypothetical protein